MRAQHTGGMRACVRVCVCVRAFERVRPTRSAIVGVGSAQEYSLLCSWVRGIAPWPILEHCWQDEIWNVTGGETRFGKQLTDEATFCPAHAHARTRMRAHAQFVWLLTCGCSR